VVALFSRICLLGAKKNRAEPVGPASLSRRSRMSGGALFGTIRANRPTRERLEALSAPAFALFLSGCQPDQEPEGDVAFPLIFRNAVIGQYSWPCHQQGAGAAGRPRAPGAAPVPRQRHDDGGRRQSPRRRSSDRLALPGRRAARPSSPTCAVRWASACRSSRPSSPRSCAWPPLARPEHFPAPRLRLSSGPPSFFKKDGAKARVAASL
jgi:hypothetical protein